MLGVEIGERLEIRLLKRRAATQERALESIADEIVAKPADRTRKRAARGLWQGCVERASAARVQQRARIAAVPREQLIAAFARQHDFHARCRELGHEEQRNAGRERQRLIAVAR